jgi:hypothetical protein
VPYSEAIYLAFASAFLLALLHQRYWLAVPLLVAAALSKGYGPSLSAAAIVSVAWHGHASRVRGASYRSVSTEWLRSGGLILTMAALVVPFVWIRIADAVTGTPGAYSATQRAWGYSRDAVVWRNGWAEMLGRLHWVDIISVLTLVAVVALAVAALRLRQLPWFLKFYTLAAAALMGATALPGAVSFTSLPRFAFGVLTVPIILGVLVSRRAVAVGIVGLFLCLEYLWVLNIWTGRIGIAP